MTIGDWDGEALAVILKAFTLTNNLTTLTTESSSSGETEPSISSQTYSGNSGPIAVATDSIPSSTVNIAGTNSSTIAATDATTSTITAAGAGAASSAVAATTTISSTVVEAPLPILGKSRRRARPDAAMLRHGSHCAVHSGPCYCYLLVKGQQFGYMWKWTSDLDELGRADPGKHGFSEDGEGTGPGDMPGVDCVEEYQGEMTEMMWEVFDNFVQRRAERMRLPKR